MNNLWTPLILVQKKGNPAPEGGKTIVVENLVAMPFLVETMAT
jgi:hypothetical protein